MAAEVAQPVAPVNNAPPLTTRPPRYTGHYDAKYKWFCDCPLKASCLTATRGSRNRQPFWICPHPKDHPDKCKFSLWQEDEAEAILFHEAHGPPTPPQVEGIIAELQRVNPKTPVKPKVDKDITPWTLAKRKPVSREHSGAGLKSDNGEGRAPPKSPKEAQTVFDLTSTDDSDPPPPKRARFSSSTPLGAPKKARLSFSTPSGSPNLSTPSGSPARELATLGGKTLSERMEECRQDPQASLPTPETGHRFQRIDKGKGREILASTAGAANVLHSPINLDDSDSDSPDNTPPSPSRKAKKSSRSQGQSKTKGKGKEREKAHETPQALTSAIMAILKQEGHVLKDSTRMMIEHEIELAMDIKDVSIKASEKTILKMGKRLDELGCTLALLTEGAGVDEFIELSD